MENIIDVLKERGLLDAVTSEELRARANVPLSIYVGFDPTADSLHLGNLLGMIVLRWFQKCGHRPVVLIGGATARIGDPSGKSVERPLLTHEEIELNIKGIEKNFAHVLDFSDEKTKPIFVNNYHWYASYSFIDLMRDVGKHFRVGTMLGKESVRARLDSEEGMSFTELSYQMLQGYDFFYLLKNYGVCVQAGGSDQWGNITAGTDYIRRMRATTALPEAYGLTFPLLVNSEGKKFGKSEKGAIWLSPEKLSPYHFYQELVRVADADVVQMLYKLTFISTAEIKRLSLEMNGSEYVPNTLQRRLAEEVTRCVHGEKGLNMALEVTNALMPGSETVLKAEIFEAMWDDLPHMVLDVAEVVGKTFADIACIVKLCESKGEGSRLIKSGGAYLNNKKIMDVAQTISREDFIGNKYFLLASGKKKKIVIKVTSC